MNDYEFYAKKYSHHLAVFETLGNFKKYKDILLAKNKTSSAGVACHRRTRRTSRKRMVNTPKIRHRQRPILRVQVATATTTTRKVLCHKIFECKVRDLQLATGDLQLVVADAAAAAAVSISGQVVQVPWRAPARRRARNSSTTPSLPFFHYACRQLLLASAPHSSPLTWITNWSRQQQALSFEKRKVKSIEFGNVQLRFFFSLLVVASVQCSWNLQFW